MAYITEISEIQGVDCSRVHRTCTAGWRVTDRHGMKVLQLDTYGSPDRKDTGTVSQSLQIDEVRARELVAIIRRAFPTIQ